MTWLPMQLAKPLSAASGLGNLSVLKADPFMHGIGEVVNGQQLLSFPNAVKSLADKLNVNKAALAVGFGGVNLQDLTDQLGGFTDVLPLPYFKQLHRRANSLLTLAEDKLELVDFMSSNLGLNLQGLAGIKDMVKAAKIQAALDRVQDLQSTDPLTLLNDFATEKAGFDVDLSDLLGTVGNGLTGEFGQVFYAEDNIASRLLTGGLSHDATHSAIMMFQGEPEELAYLTELFKPSI